MFTFESKVSFFQKIQDYMRSIKLESRSSPTKSDSQNDATSEAELKSPDGNKTDAASIKTKGKRKKQKESPLRNEGSEETQKNKAFKRDCDKDGKSRTAAEIAELQDKATAPSEGGHRPAMGGATAADSDIERRLLSIAAVSYKKLLVGMDTEEPWFVQVSAVLK